MSSISNKNRHFKNMFNLRLLESKTLSWDNFYQTQFKKYDTSWTDHNLQEALEEVKKLSGMLPICSSCKKIRDDNGYWNQVEAYIVKHSDAEFSHSICPECAERLYPDLDIYDE